MDEIFYYFSILKLNLSNRRWGWEWGNSYPKKTYVLTPAFSFIIAKEDNLYL